MRYLENFSAVTPITYKIPGNFFYLDSLPGGLATVRFFRNGVRLAEDLTNIIAGWHATIREGFDEVEISSTLTQALSFYIARGEVGANVFSGNVAVTSLPGDQYGAAFASTTLLTANTPENVITAAANLNGYTAWRSFMQSGSAVARTIGALLAKATAPATVIDGDVLQHCLVQIDVAGNFQNRAQSERPVRVASGKRLDFITTAAEGINSVRSVLYTIH